MDTELYDRLIAAAFRFISFRRRSESEIKQYLQKRLLAWKVKNDEVARIVYDRLREMGYADDSTFATWWISARQSTKPRGTLLIARELAAKGVHKEIISELLRQNDSSEDASGGTKELESARIAINRKLPQWSKLTTLDRTKKLYSFLHRRGFQTETIRRIIDELEWVDYNLTE